MKKVLVLSFLALGALAVSEQKASAWANFKFGIGANLSYTSGGNSFGWGLWTNGPAPGCCAPEGGYPGHGGFGGDFYSQGPAAPTGTTPVAAPAQIQPVQYPAMGYPGGYQPVSYYPGFNYGYYQAPSYWYGR
jgi:hypothetical protein